MQKDESITTRWGIKMPERLRDIVDIPEVKLVIELDDADRDPAGITSSFVITREVEDNLAIILNRLNQDRGCGIFIKGNYGSGKSHFLSYLYLLLKGKNLPILDNYPSIKEREMRVTKISLVKYPASHGLERIVLSSLGYEGDVLNREETFRGILRRPSVIPPSAPLPSATPPSVILPTVILIDELSEFLRSKPSPSSFYEDVRFLQFLGEFSSQNPLWVIATLQEWIEETGHISSDIFNRIKDRYPLRLNLTSSHIEDIIDRRIVLKREGADEVISGERLNGTVDTGYIKERLKGVVVIIDGLRYDV